MKVLKSLLYVSLVLFFAIFFSTAARADVSKVSLSEISMAADSLPSPTLIAPDEKTITAQVKPLIIGLTRSDSLVKIFIDGIYNGKTEILNNKSNTANFAYRPFLNLSRGWHKVYAIAEDKTGRVSRMSEVLNFNIESPMPAPTMLKPVVNKNTSDTKPFIVGLAKNDSKIKVYIDKKYNGEFEVKNHPSGTANFAYKPIISLARGNHLVYTVAVDKRGKQSAWSNIVYFSTRNSAIAKSAQEKSDNVANVKGSKDINQINTEVPVISERDRLGTAQLEKQGVIKNISQQGEAIFNKIKNFIGYSTVGKSKAVNDITEGNEFNQGKLKLSLVIFILFLVGVVAWLLWVNHELVKERRAQNKIEVKDKENKLL